MTELRIVKFFNRLGRGTAIDWVTDFVSRILYLAVFWMLFAIAIFFLAENGKIIALAMTIAAGLHFLISEGVFKRLLLKYFAKIRPYVEHPKEVFPIGRRHSDSSFPSSHMSANLAVFTVLAYFYPSMWLIITLLVLLIAFARLHNGMHYLSDVVAGIVFGIVYGIVGIYLSNAVVSALL
ncbi:MAG: phosphatase PAP2 family protein [Candidatus Moranbacteria bacterium]|nr:phosphatase PAP2 family protein [Candidatus Moranbacteria bacterium]